MLANRANDRDDRAMRNVKLTRGIMKNANGSCLAEFGDTRVLCTATIERPCARLAQGSGKGWLTAEYAMLPAAGNKRTRRETNGRNGRSMEIERPHWSQPAQCVRLELHGRRGDHDHRLRRAAADGGTRTAAITGAWVAAYDAFEMWKTAGRIKTNPLLCGCRHQRWFG